MYRASVTLTEPIDPEVLASAQLATLKRVLAGRNRTMARVGTRSGAAPRLWTGVVPPDR